MSIKSLPKKAKNLTGLKFSRLIVIDLIDWKHQGRWLCKCDCGKEVIVQLVK